MHLVSFFLFVSSPHTTLSLHIPFFFVKLSHILTHLPKTLMKAKLFLSFSMFFFVKKQKLSIMPPLFYPINKGFGRLFTAWCQAGTQDEKIFHRSFSPFVSILNNGIFILKKYKYKTILCKRYFSLFYFYSLKSTNRS